MRQLPNMSNRIRRNLLTGALLYFRVGPALRDLTRLLLCNCLTKEAPLRRKKAGGACVTIAFVLADAAPRVTMALQPARNWRHGGRELARQEAASYVAQEPNKSPKAGGGEEGRLELACA